MILSSCAQADNEGTINPGDRVGSFLVTTGVGEELVYGWDLDNFVQQGEKIYSVELHVGTKMNASARMS